jgi:hypothetical protein
MTDQPDRHARSEKSLGELEERFFDLAIDMLCVLDFNGHFKRLNPTWETTLGFTQGRADVATVHRVRASRRS